MKYEDEDREYYEIRKVKKQGHSKKELVRWNNAIWQYLIDHSSITKSGHLYINFYIKDEKEFFKRVKARERGDFKRIELKEVKKEVEEIKKVEKVENRIRTAIVKRFDEGLAYKESDEPLDKIMTNVMEICVAYKKERIKELKEDL